MLFRHSIVCASLLLLASAFSMAGEKKGGMKERGMEGPGAEFEFIKAHDKELGLTDEQKKKLADLQGKAETLREKMRDDPETRNLFVEMKEARKSGDEEKMRALRQQIKEIMDKKSGGETPLAQLPVILSPQQMLKLKELRESEGRPMMGDGEGKGPRRGGKGGKEENLERPDPAKGKPSLYDNEK